MTAFGTMTEAVETGAKTDVDGVIERAVVVKGANDDVGNAVAGVIEGKDGTGMV